MCPAMPHSQYSPFHFTTYMLCLYRNIYRIEDARLLYPLKHRTHKFIKHITWSRKTCAKLRWRQASSDHKSDLFRYRFNKFILERGQFEKWGDANLDNCFISWNGPSIKYLWSMEGELPRISQSQGEAPRYDECVNRGAANLLWP